MAIVFPDEGRKLALSILLLNSEFAKIRLYKTEITLDNDTEVGDFTQADFSGYNAQDLIFSAPTINGSGQGELSLNDITFTHDAGVDGGNEIFGWYITITEPGNGVKLLFCEEFPESVLVNVEDDRVKFDLRLFDRLAGE